MKRREFSNKVRGQIAHRAMNADGQIACEKCGLILGKKPYEIDHIIAEALVIDKSKPLTAEDGQLLGYCCHRGEDGKTSQDVADIARAKRREARHVGAWRPKGNIPSPPPRPKPFRDKLPLPGPISLYEER